MTIKTTRGAHHIGLTVPNLTRSEDFFVNTLGYDKLGEVPDYPAVFLSDGATMITLSIWRMSSPRVARTMSRA